MHDLLLAFQALGADLSLTDVDLGVDDGLLTAVVVSLFTDALAESTDELPTGETCRRGWWGDATLDDADSLGSRLWLLAREKVTDNLLARFEEYAAEALAWLVEDGHCGSVSVSASRSGTYGVAVGVVLSDPDESFEFSYDLSTEVA